MQGEIECVGEYVFEWLCGCVCVCVRACISFKIVSALSAYEQMSC